MSHGQSLIWSDPKSGTGLQGVTELIECERTKDPWLKSVQDEFRIGKLSADSHAFLHGAPTLAPGMTIAGKSTCRHPCSGHDGTEQGAFVEGAKRRVGHGDFRQGMYKL